MSAIKLLLQTDTRGAQSQTQVEAAAEYAAMAELLLEMEWSRDEVSEFCAVCNALKEDGHTSDCRLAAVIRGLDSRDAEGVE